MRFPRLLFLVLLLLGVGGAALAADAGRAAPAGLGVAQARFDPPGPWPAAAPVTLTVQFDRDVLLASWQWLGADSRPVAWAGTTLPAQDLRPVQGRWMGRVGAPPVPGTYGVRVVARAADASTFETITLGLRGASVADDQPITRGLVYTRNGNLWLRALDLGRERAATFYGTPASAAMPAWAPDGRRVAFIYDRGTVSGGPELWLIAPNGTGARRVASPAPGRSLAYPAWAPDGTLYVAESRPLQFQGVDLGDTWDVAQVDLASGALAPVVAGALMPDISPDGKRMVYVQQTLTAEGAIEQALAVADVDGRNEQVLVPSIGQAGFYAPSWSPDGATILYAGQTPLPPGGAMDAGRWTIESRDQGSGIRDQDYALRITHYVVHGPWSIVGPLTSPLLHGGPWDIRAVPAGGGAVRVLAAVQEDNPYPRWTADGRRIFYISPTGLWALPAGGGTPVRVGDNEAHSEMSVFAPVPRPAPPLTGASRCFSETGQCLRGLFLRYWDSHGGLAQFGFPTTGELIEEGRTVQYTQRARFEWHPENAGGPYEVLLGRLGADFADARAASGEAPFQRQPRPANAALRYFTETGHALAPPLQSYWERQGGLPVFGYPLSDPFMEKNPSDGQTYLVQYFERNRLEYHPEYAGTPSAVLLGLLGVQEYTRRYND